MSYLPDLFNLELSLYQVHGRHHGHGQIQCSFVCHGCIPRGLRKSIPKPTIAVYLHIFRIGSLINAETVGRYQSVAGRFSHVGLLSFRCSSVPWTHVMVGCSARVADVKAIHPYDSSTTPAPHRNSSWRMRGRGLSFTALNQT